MKGTPLKRLIALSVLALFVWACESSPTDVSKPPAGVKPNFSISCTGVPNGGVVGLTMSPHTATIDRSLNQTVRINAKVWRDDPNTPGVQFYCYDPSVVLHFVYYNTGRVQSAIFGTDASHPQYTIAGPGTCTIATCGANTNGPAKVGTSIYPGYQDSTIVTIVP